MLWDDLLKKVSYEMPPLSRLAFCCAISYRLLKLREQQISHSDCCQGALIHATNALWKQFENDCVPADFNDLHQKIQFCIPGLDGPNPGFHQDINLFACVDECISVAKGVPRMKEIVSSYYAVLDGHLAFKLIPPDVKYTTIKDNAIIDSHPQVNQEKKFLENVFVEVLKNLNNKENRKTFKQWTLKQCSGRLWLV